MRGIVRSTRISTSALPNARNVYVATVLGCSCWLKPCDESGDESEQQHGEPAQRRKSCVHRGVKNWRF